MNDDLYADSAQYDAMYADLVTDLPILAAVAREAGGPVLELCCGTGRVLLPLLRAGVDADGLDLSPEMLAGLRARLAAEGLSAGVHAGDMRDFALPRRYALVLIAFNSFLHNLTQPDQLATLRRCRAHLAPGGRLAIIAFHPGVEALRDWAAGERVVKDVPNPNGAGRVRVRDLTTDDRIEQVRHVVRTVDYLDDADTRYRAETLRFALRYVFKPEMELLLGAAGFTRWTARALEIDTATGALAPVARALREGDTLLWTAWDD